MIFTIFLVSRGCILRACGVFGVWSAATRSSLLVLDCRARGFGIFVLLASRMRMLCRSVGGRTNQTVLAISDEVLSARFDKRLTDEVGILGSVILQKRALKLLFVIIGSYVDRLHIKRIYSRVIHDRGRGARGGIVILHLLGRVVVALEAKCEVDRVVER